jgi:hypothetical protein
LRLAELLLPLLGAVVARGAPAVEELVGGGAGAEHLGDDRPSVSSPTSRAAPASPPAASSALPGRPVRMSA